MMIAFRPEQYVITTINRDDVIDHFGSGVDTFLLTVDTERVRLEIHQAVLIPFGRVSTLTTRTALSVLLLPSRSFMLIASA